jgi:membrane-associated phospholipid phosphatase
MINIVGGRILEKTRKKVAEAISAILNAPIVACYAFAILILFENLPSPLLLFIVSFFFGSLLPFATILYMAKTGVISDIYASERQTRTKPFIGALASYLTGIMVLVLFRAPQILVALMACYFVNSLAMMIISQVWKISIHASGVTGPATFLIHQLGVIMIPFLILIFPVAWARIELGAHSLKQVVAGALLTILLTFVQLELYL